MNPSKPQHRLTPTQLLRQQIARLEAQLADRDRADDDTVYERRFLISGHFAGVAAFIAARRYGDAWSVQDNNAGFRSVSWWDGREWRDWKSGMPLGSVYRFTQGQAAALAEGFARDAAGRHGHYADVLEQVRRIERHADDALENLAGQAVAS